MRKSMLAAVPLAALALAAPASAHDGRHAGPYRATLAPIAVEAPPATAAKRDREAAAKGVRGKAELRDRSRRDRVDLRVKGLAPATGYRWEVRKAATGEDACSGEAVAEFAYGPLAARRHGGGKARAVSRSFAVESGAVYAVVVSTEDADVACGVFRSKADLKRAKAERKAQKQAAEDHAGEDDSSDDESEDDDSADDGAEDESLDDGSDED